MLKEIKYIIAGQYMRFYNSGRWRRRRLEALKRDHYECQHCAKEGKVTTKSPADKTHKKILEVHHIIPIKDNPYRALDLDNLITLCTFHHNVVEGRTIIGDANKKLEFDNEERW